MVAEADAAVVVAADVAEAEEEADVAVAVVVAADAVVAAAEAASPYSQAFNTAGRGANVATTLGRTALTSLSLN